MILQLNPTLDVHTPLGYGKAMFLIDRSEQINSIWKVRMYDSGKMINFYDDDILIYPNKMDGECDLEITKDLVK
jgi:hypothetical protein